MYLKNILLRYLTRHLLKAVNEDDLLLITNRGWMSRGQKLSAEEVAEIKAQAKDFSDSLLWHFISRELEYAAFVRGRKAQSISDINATFYLYYNLDLIQKFLDRCKSL